MFTKLILKTKIHFHRARTAKGTVKKKSRQWAASLGTHQGRGTQRKCSDSMKNNQAQHLGADGSCTREKDVSDTWWNLRKTKCCMNHKFSGFTIVLLALSGKCKPESPGTQGPGPHHACKKCQSRGECTCVTHTRRDTKAEHTSQWMSNGVGRVRLVDSYERFLSSWTICVPFLKFKVISKWKVKIQWFLASGCWYTTLWVQWINSFNWLFCVAYHNKNNDYEHPCHRLTTACNFNPRGAGSTDRHSDTCGHIHMYKYIQVHTI